MRPRGPHRKQTEEGIATLVLRLTDEDAEVLRVLTARALLADSTHHQVPGSFSFTTPGTHVGWRFSLLLSGMYSFGVTYSLITLIKTPF